MKKEIAKHRALIQSCSKITAMQKKIFNSLIYIAKPQLLKNPNIQIFTTSISEIEKLIKDKQRINLPILKMSLKKISDVAVDFNILKNEKLNTWVTLHLISQATVSEDSTVTFEFPSLIKENIIAPDIFCVLDLNIISKLKSKYAISIYEFCKDYANVRVPKINLEELKKLIGIDKGYIRIFDLRRYVLDPAINEINEKTNLKISYDFIVNKKKITHIIFCVDKQYKYSKLNKEEEINPIPVKENIAAIIALTAKYEILHAKEVLELEKLVEAYGEEVVISNIKYTNRQDYKNYFIYLKKAIEGDYAEKDRIKNEMLEAELKKREDDAKREEEIFKKRNEEVENLEKIFESLSKEKQEELEKKIESEFSESDLKFKQYPSLFKSIKHSRIIEFLKNNKI